MNESIKSSRGSPEEMTAIRGWFSLLTNPKARVGDTLAQGPQRHSTDAPFSFTYGAQ